MECGFEELKKRFRIVETIARRDVEELHRMLSTEERVELWNKLRELSKWYMFECSGSLEESVDRYYDGLLRLAQLKIADTFRREGSMPDIVASFRPEEYEVLEAFEAMKVIDGLSEDHIVEFIERREGKVYEVVKEYYEKQFDMLERSWTPLIGSLASVIADLYAERRRKIEEAIVRYIRKRGLTGFILEIEEAMKRLEEAAGVAASARGVAEEAERLLSIVEEGSGVNESRIGEVEERIEELRRRIAELERELEEARSGRLRAAVEAELEALRRERVRLEEEKRKIEAVRAALELERSKLREALGHEGEGRPAAGEDVEAAEVGFLEKVRLRLEEGFRLFDAIRNRELKPGRWVLERSEGDAGGFRVSLSRLVRYKGLIFKRPEAAVEIAVVYPPEIDEVGVSKKPVGLAAIADLVKERLGRDYYTVLVVVAPTGFTEPAIEFIAGGSMPPYASRTITVYLVDPAAARVYYNEADEAARRNLELAKPLLDEEAVAKVYRWLGTGEARSLAAKASPVRPFLLAGEVARRLGVDRNAVRAAFERMAEEGRARIVEAGGDIALVYQ